MSSAAPHFTNEERETIFNHILQRLLCQTTATKFYIALNDIYAKKDPTSLVALTDEQIAAHKYKPTNTIPAQPFSDDHCNLLRIFRDFIRYKSAIGERIPPTIEGWTSIDPADFYDYQISEYYPFVLPVEATSTTKVKSERSLKCENQLN